jgi:hypothetical protein
LELSEDQFYVLLEFGIQPARLSSAELEKQVARMIAVARFELERIGERGRRISDLPHPETVLEAFARTYPDDPREILAALDYSVGSLTVEEAEARLGDVMSRAQREVERVAARAKGDAGGDILMLGLPFPPLSRSLRTIELASTDLRNGDSVAAGENEGPWGGSLAWLDAQRRPEPADPCDRCNWKGRFPELVGVDDGTNPLRLLARAKPRSTGASRPFLPRYRSQPIDNMASGGDRRCANCGGTGHLEPLAWSHDPRLQGRPVEMVDEDDGHNPVSRDIFDGLGRLRPPVDEVGGQRSSLSGELPGAVGEDGEFPWGTSAVSVMFDERLAAERLHRAALRYRNTGRLEIEGVQVEEHKRDYAENANRLEPLPLRQFLADIEFGGGGRKNLKRALAFLKRDAVIFELVQFGFPAQRIAQAVRLSDKQLYSLKAYQAANRAFVANQKGVIGYWHDRGHSTNEIAQATGVGVIKVRRILREMPEPQPSSLQEDPLMESLRLTLLYGPVLREMGITQVEEGRPARPALDPEDFVSGIPIDYYTALPPGMPLYLPSSQQPYHTYLASEDDQEGAPAGSNGRSLGVLHPFFLALLTRTTPRRNRPESEQAIHTGRAERSL